MPIGGAVLHPGQDSHVVLAVRARRGVRGVAVGASRCLDLDANAQLKRRSIWVDYVVGRRPVCCQPGMTRPAGERSRCRVVA